MIWTFASSKRFKWAARSSGNAIRNVCLPLVSPKVGWACRWNPLRMCGGCSISRPLRLGRFIRKQFSDGPEELEDRRAIGLLRRL